MKISLILLSALDTSFGFSLEICHGFQKSATKLCARDERNDASFTSPDEGMTPMDRRRVGRFIFQTALTGAAAMMSNSQESNAACLSGDISPECIGVYKVPLDDNVSSYVSTPEQLAKYAPDLKWVPPVEYPKSFKLAKEELVELQSKVRNITPMIQKGDLTGAGTELLATTPRITVAGRVIIRTLQNYKEMDMRAMRTENHFLELLASLGSCDVVIGQALNGRYGSITMAQIQILEDLRNADEDFKELIRAMPEGFDG